MIAHLILIVDTSVWIDYFRGRQRGLCDHLDQLIGQARIYVPGVIKAEILQGCKSEKEARGILADLENFDLLPEDPSDWVTAGWLSFRGREKGLTFGLNDCLIASLAAKSKSHVWSLDAAYERMTKLLAIKIYTPKLGN